MTFSSFRAMCVTSLVCSSWACLDTAAKETGGVALDAASDVSAAKFDVSADVEPDAAPDVAPDTIRDAPRDAPEASGPCPGVAPDGWAYVVGDAVFGEDDYIEYVPGDLPVIIAAPHGGELTPGEMTVGEGLASDGGSLATARLLFDQIRARTGRTPHLIINHVKRNRLNLNRPDARPNEGVPSAERAWAEFHGFVEDSKG